MGKEGKDALAVSGRRVLALGMKECLLGFMQKTDRPGLTSGPGILAITADVGFYSSVLSAAYDYSWRAEWASTMSRGLKICDSQPVNIVVYDRDLPGVDWREGLRSLSRTVTQPRILLAANNVDEDLWRTVLRLRGYDVLSKPARQEQLKRELRFAWLSFDAPALRRSEEAASSVRTDR